MNPQDMTDQEIGDELSSLKVWMKTFPHDRGLDGDLGAEAVHIMERFYDLQCEQIKRDAEK